MKNLNLYQTTDIDKLATPSESQELTLDSPALAFFTDFASTTPQVIEDTTAAVDVQWMMQKAHVRMKLVVNADDQFLGVISSDHLSERRLVQKISEGFKREEISVSELMVLKTDLKALDYDEVSRATIREVVETLKDWGEQHCLVIDQTTHHIRGIFSASDISRKLRLPIDIQGPPSFYNVFLAKH